MEAARGGGWVMGKMGEGVERYKLPIVKQVSPGDTMCHMVGLVNNTVLCI